MSASENLKKRVGSQKTSWVWQWFESGDNGAK